MKRYVLHDDGLQEHPEGEWVAFEDAQLLEVELRLLREQERTPERIKYRAKPEGGGNGYYLDGEYVGSEWKDVVAAEAAGGE